MVLLLDRDEDPALTDASSTGIAPIPIAPNSTVPRAVPGRSLSRLSSNTIRGGNMDAFVPYDSPPPPAAPPSTLDDLLRGPRTAPYVSNDLFAELDDLDRFMGSPPTASNGFDPMTVYDPARSQAWPPYERSPPLGTQSPYAPSPHLSGTGLSPSPAAPFFPFLGSPTPPPLLGPYPMYRSDSNASSFSMSSSSDGDGSWGAGVNPHDVSKSPSTTSAPGTPAGGADPTLVYGRSAPAATGMGTWWPNVGSRSVDALADGLGGRMEIRTDAGMEEDEDDEANEATVRAKERMREGISSVFSGGPAVPMAIAGRASALGAGGERLSTSLPVSTLSRARGARHAAVASGSATRPSRSSPRSSPMGQRVSRSSSSSAGAGSSTAGPKYVVARNLFGGIVDYSSLPTKRSRGRRPVESRDVGLADADEYMQNVPGGSAFDPTLNPDAAAVEFCETTKTGKPKKIFVCRVTNCGKVFKRSEHLKRHVRSIHTDVKPFTCPWPSCAKLFNRHDNLNQHLRVHRTSDEGGHVLAGLGVGSDGVLRRDDTGEAVDPEPLGLRNVEIPA